MSESESSSHGAVNTFREIKKDAKCDDVSAAILTLAEHLSRITVYVEAGESGDFDRIGHDIAEAIKDATQSGAINVSPGAFKEHPDSPNSKKRAAKKRK